MQVRTPTRSRIGTMRAPTSARPVTRDTQPNENGVTGNSLQKTVIAIIAAWILPGLGHLQGLIRKEGLRAQLQDDTLEVTNRGSGDLHMALELDHQAIKVRVLADANVDNFRRLAGAGRNADPDRQ